MVPRCSEWLVSSISKVDVQFLIMIFLSPADICRLGATSRYWRAMVRDPLLWRYFLFRDMPFWTSIDHLTMPQMDAPVIHEDESLDDREEGSDKGLELKFDYMSEWVLFSVTVTQQFKKKKLPSSCILCLVFFLSTDTWRGAHPADSNGFLHALPMRLSPHFCSPWCPHLSHVMRCLALEWKSWTSLLLRVFCIILMCSRYLAFRTGR